MEAGNDLCELIDRAITASAKLFTEAIGDNTGGRRPILEPDADQCPGKGCPDAGPGQPGWSHQVGQCLRMGAKTVATFVERLELLLARLGRGA